MALKIRKAENARRQKIADFKKLNLKWSLMKKETPAQIEAANAVCARLNATFKELFPKEYQLQKDKADGLG